MGGAATYFALAASYFTDVRVVAVVGEISARARGRSEKRGVDTRGIERATGKTFRWGGQYLDNLNEAKTDFTELNVFEKFQPRIPKNIRTPSFSFLPIFTRLCKPRSGWRWMACASLAATP